VKRVERETRVEIVKKSAVKKREKRDSGRISGNRGRGGKGRERREKSSERVEEKSAESLLSIGEVTSMRVATESEFGHYLENDKGGRVLLPNIYVTEDMKVGESVEVFLYHDSDDRPVATTLRPKALLGEFAFLEVVGTTPYGAFLEWGLPKDLLVPISQQKSHFRIGDKRLVRICLDERSGRLYGTQRIGRYFDRDTGTLHIGERVSCLVIARTPMGWKVIVDGKYEGMIFENEIFHPVELGSVEEGYIKKIRKDGKLDISLQPTNRRESIEMRAESVLNLLHESGGSIPLYYKSSPEEINESLGMSRKSFKRALTYLIEKGSIEIRGETTVLKEADGDSDGRE